MSKSMIDSERNLKNLRCNLQYYAMEIYVMPHFKQNNSIVQKFCETLGSLKFRQTEI